MEITTFPITLIETVMLTPHVKHFVFQSPKSSTFNYLPGQFITLHFEKEGKVLKRSYSIANAPKQDNRIEFSAGYISGGPGTELLFHLKPGDQVTISGPFGRLILRDELPKRYILVATSTGITPYRAMIEELKKRVLENPSLQVVILQGVQKRGDILFPDEFKALQHQFSQFCFRAHLSREIAHNLHDCEYSGYVQEAFVTLALNPAEDIVYLCGNPSMIDAAFEQLKTYGFTTQQIIREKYISGKSSS